MNNKPKFLILCCNIKWHRNDTITAVPPNLFKLRATTFSERKGIMPGLNCTFEIYKAFFVTSEAVML